MLQTIDQSYEIVLSSSQPVIVERIRTPLDRFCELAAAYNGQVVFACGGRDEEGFLSKEALVLLGTGKSQRVCPLPQPRARHAITVLPDKTFLVAGGVTHDQDGSLVLARDLLVYDPHTDAWSAIAELPLRAALLVAEYVDGKVFVIGGDTGTTTEPGLPIAPAQCRDNVQILELATGIWTSGTPKPIPETGVTSAVQRNEIFVVSSTGQDGKVNPFIEVYNVDTDSWRRIPDMPTPRTSVPCGFIQGKLYCVNGQGEDLEPTSIIEVYDPSTNSWTILDAKLSASHKSGFVAKENGMILIGGKTSR